MEIVQITTKRKLKDEECPFREVTQKTPRPDVGLNNWGEGVHHETAAHSLATSGSHRTVSLRSTPSGQIRKGNLRSTVKPI